MVKKLKFNFWGIITAIACILIPIITLGGAIPTVIGVFGAIICFKFVGNTRLPSVHRIAIAVSMLSLCWGIVLLMYYFLGS